MDAVRLALLWRQKVPLRGALQSIVIDRMCGVSAILVQMYIGLPFALELLPQGAATPVALVTALMVAGCAMLLFVDRLPFPRPWRDSWLGRPLALIADIRAAIATRHTFVALLLGISVHALTVLAILLFA